VQQYKNKPFVLLGINSDSREKLQALIREKTVTWTALWDGGNSTGPIATAWNVRGWPTLYVIDQQGKIRFKGHDAGADTLIARLVEAKQ
jgi:hypothetical protein